MIPVSNSVTPTADTVDVLINGKVVGYLMESIYINNNI